MTITPPAPGAIATPAAAAEAISRAIAERDSKLPKAFKLDPSLALPTNVSDLRTTSGLLSSRQLEITSLDATGIRDAVAAGAYSSVEVAQAFIGAAAIAQQGTNCLVDLFHERALAQAAELDAFFAREAKTIGPLHGVPLSVKDHIDVEGIDTPSGLLANVGSSMAEADAHCVRDLRAAGAVLYAKTTNPQSLMHLDTTSYLGPTLNPFNTALSAGGSSGGEGALMGARGSVLGIGTDIGGSVRCPAANQGVYGFKPTVGRLPLHGIRMGRPGWEGILGTQGPFGRSLRDIDLYMSTALAAEPWAEEVKLTQIPWRAVAVDGSLDGVSGWKGMGGKLRVGVLRDDGVVRPLPPIRRALDTVVAALAKSDEIELVEFEAPTPALAWKVISGLYFADGGQALLAAIARSGEPVLPLTSWIINQGSGIPLTADAYFELAAQRDIFRDALCRYWQSTGVDVVLSPTGPSPAPPVGQAKYWGYTSFWNLANYPAISFPTGLAVDPALDIEDGPDYIPRNADDAFNQSIYSAEGSKDAPLSLQLSGFQFEDEKVLAALRVIERATTAASA